MEENVCKEMKRTLGQGKPKLRWKVRRRKRNSPRGSGRHGSSCRLGVAGGDRETKELHPQQKPSSGHAYEVLQGRALFARSRLSLDTVHVPPLEMAHSPNSGCLREGKPRLSGQLHLDNVHNIDLSKPSGDNVQTALFPVMPESSILLVQGYLKCINWHAVWKGAIRQLQRSVFVKN